MALKEPNKIIASSLDNFLVFNNPNYTEIPYVIFTVNGSGSNVTITIADADVESGNGFSLTLEGKVGSPITNTTFNTANSVTQTVFNLMECLKKNEIFFDVILNSANSIKANIDTSRKYKITTTGTVSASGTYSSVNATTNNKYVLMLKGEIDSSTTQLTMEKYNNSNSISFNVSSPFHLISYLYPFKINMQAYNIFNNVASAEVINNNEIIILPTTLSKFEDIDYNNYYRDSADPAPKDFLTTNLNRYYNYNELITLSFLSNVNGVTLKKNYYTQSGMFLTSKTGFLYSEKTEIRTDFYDTFELDEVENTYNHQVSYVEIVAISGTTELSTPIRYNVIPKCGTNNEFYFINKIGGLDSVNFLGESEFSAQIKNQNTYLKNPTQAFNKIKELEYVKNKENEIRYTNTTQMIDADTVMWLNELARSRFVFKYDPENDIKTVIIIDKLTTQTTSKQDQYEVEITWHYADNTLKI